MISPLISIPMPQKINCGQRSIRLNFERFMKGLCEVYDILIVLAVEAL